MIAALSFVAASSAAAPDLGGGEARAARAEAVLPRPLAGWPLLEVRGGLDAGAGVAAPTVCTELSPLRYVALEACGSAAGILFPQRRDEMVHFRAEGSIPIESSSKLELLLQPGLGFAELESGSDEPGFLFGPARSADQREGAGPEASLGVKGRAWAHERAYVSGEATAGAAWIPSAPTVTGRGSAVVPFVVATVGVGF